MKVKHNARANSIKQIKQNYFYQLPIIRVVKVILSKLVDVVINHLRTI